MILKKRESDAKKSMALIDEGFNMLNASEETDFKSFADYLEKKRSYYTKFEMENLLNMARRGSFQEAFRQANKIIIDRKYNVNNFYIPSNNNIQKRADTYG